MKLNKYIFIIVAALFTVTSVNAQNGTAAYEYLNIPVSSHVYGLGGHNLTIIDDDVNLIEQNPALLGPEIEKQVGLNYMRYLGSSNFMGARFGMGINDRSAWAASIQYFGYGNMTQTDPDGTISGTFNASDIAFTGSYSHDITERWRGGINIKFLSSKYAEYSALAICADLGVNYYNPDNDLSFSVVLKSLGAQVKKFNETYDKLPWDIQIGYSQSLSEAPIRFSITATNLTKWKLPYYQREDANSTTSELVKKESFSSNLFRHLTFAAEYAPSDKFYIGLGYNYKTRTDMTTYSRNFLSGFSLAGGIKVKSFGVGVALSQPHVGGTTFMLNFTMALSSLLN